MGKQQGLQNNDLSKIISLNIYGTDINKEFISFCRKYITQKIYGVPSVKSRIKVTRKDFLSIDKKEVFDIIIGNPPYGIPGNDRHYPIIFTREQKLKYKKYFQTWKGKYNIYALFIEQGLNLLKKGGRLAFIVPATFMILDDFEKLRKYLSVVGKIEIEYLGHNIFKDALVSTVLLKITKGGRGLILRNGQYYFEQEYYDGDLIRFDNYFTKNLEKKAPYRLGDIFNIHIAARSPEVKNNPYVIRTTQVCQQKKGWSSKKIVTIDKANKEKPKGYVPLLNGRNLKPFKIDYKNNFSGYWIKKNKIITLRRYYLENRIAVGHTKGGKIEAAVENKQYPWISDVYFLIPKDNYSSLFKNSTLFTLEEITYILNSQLAQKLMKTLYSDITPHITLTQLKRFPIYPKKRWEELEEKYGKM